MTVKELKEALDIYPDDMKVFTIEDADCVNIDTVYRIDDFLIIE